MPGIPVRMGAQGHLSKSCVSSLGGLSVENIFPLVSCLGSLLIGEKQNKKQKGYQRPSLGFPDSDLLEAWLEGGFNWLLSEPPGPAGQQAGDIVRGGPQVPFPPPLTKADQR